MKRVIEEVRRCANGRELVLYGCSNMAEALRQMFESGGCYISFAVDRNYAFFHNMHCQVLPPDLISPKKHFPIIVPFGQAAVKSILDNCLRKGYQEGDWFIWYRDVHFDIEFNDLVIGKQSQLSLALIKFDAHKYIRSVGRYTAINHSFSYGADHAFGLSTSELVAFHTLTGVKQLEGRLQIGHDVWIGANTFINCSKVKSVGNGAVIATGAVVLEDVPPYAVVAGVPAKIKKYRFAFHEIEVLQKVQWWNWSDQQMIQNADCFSDVSLFFKRFGG